MHNPHHWGLLFISLFTNSVSSFHLALMLSGAPSLLGRAFLHAGRCNRRSDKSLTTLAHDTGTQLPCGKPTSCAIYLGAATHQNLVTHPDTISCPNTLPSFHCQLELMNFTEIVSLHCHHTQQAATAEHGTLTSFYGDTSHFTVTG